MSIKVGDKVRFLNEKGDGVIKKVTKDTVYVMIEDGFEIPYKPSEVFVIGSASKASQEKSHEIQKEEPKEEFNLSDVDLTSPVNTERNLVIGFVPANPANVAVSNIDMYLINDSNYGLYYTVSEKREDNARIIAHGAVEDNTKIHLHAFSQSALSQTGNIYVQAIYFGIQEYEYVKPVEDIISVKAYDFYRGKSYKENDYFEENAIVITLKNADFELALSKLAKKDIEAVLREKEPVQKKQETLKPSNPIEEVDLHIHEIIDDFKDLSNGAILEIQLGRFETTLEGAINNKQNRIVYIHGVGNGKLKYELRKRLDGKFPDIKYQDASFKEYGYGATMVLLK